MNVNLYIERLVIDGMALSPGEQAVLRSALMAELARLMGVQIARLAQSGRSVSCLQAEPIELGPSADATHLGKEIARSVYTGLNR